MKPRGKKTKRGLRDLSQEAFSRQQHAHLQELSDKFDSWRSGLISDDELASFLWDLLSGPSKQLRDRHAYLDPGILVAGAVADGVLQESDLPEDMRETILGKAQALVQASWGRYYQFRITLKDTDPPIWRQVRVPENYSFWDLHVAIQDSMGWQDYHLHEFRMRNPSTGKIDKIGIPDPDGFPDDKPMHPSWRVPIARLFTLQDSVADYTYDFGDDWEHSIILEDIQPCDADSQYPACIGGAHACPPEDVGGIHGYQEFLASIADPDHLEHDRNLEWIGGSYDSKAFNPDDVKFDDPQERWNRAFGEANHPDA